jgi:hypothetical protein
VEASILARLLRIRLLTLEATVVVVPADVTAPSSPPDVNGRWSVRSADPVPARPAASGRRSLVEAVRAIDEATAILAEARRIAPSRRRHD